VLDGFEPVSAPEVVAVAEKVVGDRQVNTDYADDFSTNGSIMWE
jgi:hypothetical protein